MGQDRVILGYMDKHASDRLMERFAIKYTVELKRQIIESIESGEAIFLGYGHSGSKYYSVELEGQTVYLIYKKPIIKTFLTKNKVTYDKEKNILVAKNPTRNNRKAKKSGKYKKELRKKRKTSKKL